MEKEKIESKVKFRELGEFLIIFTSPKGDEVSFSLSANLPHSIYSQVKRKKGEKRLAIIQENEEKEVQMLQRDLNINLILETLLLAQDEMQLSSMLNLLCSNCEKQDEIIEMLQVCLLGYQPSISGNWYALFVAAIDWIFLSHLEISRQEELILELNSKLIDDQ